jgi:hypothetical protein
MKQDILERGFGKHIAVVVNLIRCKCHFDFFHYEKIKRTGCVPFPPPPLSAGVAGAAQGFRRQGENFSRTFCLAQSHD